MSQEPESEKKLPRPQGILDAVSFTQQTAALRTFNPQSFLNEYLETLKPREKSVITSRYGLEDGQPQTLESIGQRLNLTRERVRQLEKESLKKLNETAPPASFTQGVDLIFRIIEEQGNIARESKILDTILQNNKSEVGKQGMLFILHLAPRFYLFKDNEEFHQGWYITGFDQKLLEEVIAQATEVLKTEKKPLSKDELLAKIRDLSQTAEISNLSAEVLESYIGVSKKIGKNPFRHWGLVSWSEIHPKDVGDKAYLVLLNHSQPEHYCKITEMINKQEFDKRIAHKETVHNELIKDQRFVLVGRGIYALKKWGFRPGTVSDIVKEILLAAGRPLTKTEIIEQVLKQRFVKKNTIIVGLANKKLFRKTPDNKYILA